MGSWCVPVLFSQNCASHHSPWHSMREYHYRYEVFKFDTYCLVSGGEKQWKSSYLSMLIQMFLSDYP